MARLDKDMGSSAYDDIFAGTEPTALVGTVKLAAGQGTVERGTIVIGTPGQTFRVVDKAPTSSETGYIVCEDTDTGSDDESDPVVAFVYKTGCFIRQRLKTDGTYQLTDVEWAKLRHIGIQSEDLFD